MKVSKNKHMIIEKCFGYIVKHFSKNKCTPVKHAPILANIILVGIIACI